MQDLTNATYSIDLLVNAPRVPFKFDGRILFSSGQGELIHLTLQPGEGMNPHEQPMDVVFFVIEGTGRLTVGEDSVLVTENTTIHLLRGVQRAWTNAGNTPLRILVSKLPNAG